MRKATVQRKTNETDINLELNIDGRGMHTIDTGVPFLDHMLAQVALHGLFDLNLQARGDLEIDAHHTVEDCGLALGQAFDKALGERIGIIRMGSIIVPMDEAAGQIALDLSGRSYAVLDFDWAEQVIGGMPASLLTHFFESFATTLRANLHGAILYGRNGHHQAEALFKALGRALDMATTVDPRRQDRIPSTKGQV